VSDPRYRRAAAYFAVCLLVTAVVRPSPSLDAPVLPVVGCLLLVAVAYGLVWPRGTVTLDRPQDPVSTGFGLVWGACEGLLLLSVATALGSPWLAFAVLAAFLGAFHALWWDKQVAPEHNIPSWDLPKVLLCHVPNLTCSLWLLEAHGAGGWFVLLQVLALTLSSRAMRFPRPARPAREQAA
jgi:hypothetical protein